MTNNNRMGNWKRFCVETGRNWEKYANIPLIIEFAEWSVVDLLNALRNTDAHFSAHFGEELWSISESAVTIRDAIARAEGKV